MLFELLTGTVPFHGTSFLEVALRHVSDPAPSVLEHRPDAPARVAGAVARTLDKDPNRRFQSMEEFVAELAACLGDQEQADDSTLSLAPSTSARPTGRRAHSRKRRLSLALLALGLLLLGGVAATHLISNSSHTPALAATIHLRALAPYDPPPGDGVEDNQRLPLATDGKPATSWATEWYTNPNFGNLKSGVGIVLDTGKPLRLHTLTVHSDTPGYTAIIKAGSTQTGPFQPVSHQQTASYKTTFSLHAPVPREYYLLWITKLSPNTQPHYQTHINEVSAS